MPPKIFRSIAVDRIGGVSVSDWATCPKKKIRTKEGGDVYFYAVRKTAQAVYEKKRPGEVQPTEKGTPLCRTYHDFLVERCLSSY
jgi:hypothetical protein